MMAAFSDSLPTWLRDSLQAMALPLELMVIVFVAWLLRRTVMKLIRQIVTAYNLPIEMQIGARRIAGFIIVLAATMLILERIGVSATVLWTAFTGFATVAAVAFFAAWSVLSNIFCTLLIFTTGLFRLQDLIELVESGDKVGLKGRVIDINLVYTTLEEVERPGSPVLKVPNSLFFQRTVRRWREPPSVGMALPATGAATAVEVTNAADSGGPVAAGGERGTGRPAG